MAGIVSASILGAGAIGAGASLGGALIGSSASNRALAQQRDLFNQARAEVAPFTNFGQSLIPTLQSLLTPGPNQSATLAQTPGFQFAYDWGTRGALNRATASGWGGNVGTALSQFGTGLAQNTFFPLIQALQGGVNTGATAAESLVGPSVTAGQNMANTLFGGANFLSSGLSGAAGNAGNSLLLSGLINGRFGANSTPSQVTAGVYGGVPFPIFGTAGPNG